MRLLLSVLVILSAVIGCKKNSTEEPVPILPLTVAQLDQPSCFESRPLVRRSSNLTGRISFSKKENLYSINRSVPGTYDSVWVGFVCNLPDEYKVLNKQVVFSGEYRKGPEGVLIFAGEETYYLFLTDIK